MGSKIIKTVGGKNSPWIRQNKTYEQWHKETTEKSAENREKALSEIAKRFGKK